MIKVYRRIKHNATLNINKTHLQLSMIIIAFKSTNTIIQIKKSTTYL